MVAGDNVSFSTETTTDSSGNYKLHGLPSGRYGVGFIDLCDAEHDHVTEFFDEKPSFAKADPVPVTAPGETTGIDATLSPIAIVSDVEVNISDKPDPVAVGRTLTYRITVLNHGPDRATDVSMMLGYPDGTTLVSVTAHRRSCVVDERLRTVTCDLGDLARDAVTTVRVAIAPGNAGTIATTVAVSAVEPDPDATNNSAVEGTQVLGGRTANRH